MNLFGLYLFISEANYMIFNTINSIIITMELFFHN